jgi:hypothetical protein
MACAPPPELQREGLEAVLRSRTFHRAEQLKRFLRYICETEWQGRREALTEYAVGVNALGRAEDFSPEVDSTVRTRAHALRQKLQEYYERENPEAPIRIELPRGGYIPVFSGGAAEAASVQAAGNEPAGNAPYTGAAGAPVPAWNGAGERAPIAVNLEPVAVPQTAAARRRWHTVAAFTAGVGTAAVVAALAFAMGWAQPGVRAQTPEVIRDFWGPWLKSDTPVAICVGQPLHLWVRDYGGAPPPVVQYGPFRDPAPSSPEFRQWYEGYVRPRPDSRLVLHPSPYATLWSDAAGAASAAQFFARHRVQVQLLPEKSLRGVYSLRHQNRMVFGRPEFSPIMMEFRSVGGFTVAYLPDVQRHAIVHQQDSSRRFLNPLTESGNYGLITVIAEDAGREKNTVLFSGVIADGSQAGVEFMLSAAHLADLRDRLRRQGHQEWPAVFQVVVKSRSSGGFPVEIEYVQHEVLR